MAQNKTELNANVVVQVPILPNVFISSSHFSENVTSFIRHVSGKTELRKAPNKTHSSLFL